MKTRNWILLTVTVVLAGLITLNGCKKKEAPKAPEMPAAQPSAQGTTEAAGATEQTTCPVMGGAINKEIFTEYKGQKVYFCCPACKPEFEKDPEKYLAKLPQFQN